MHYYEYPLIEQIHTYGNAQISLGQFVKNYFTYLIEARLLVFALLLWFTVLVSTFGPSMCNNNY
jgi:hypothetical protein